MPSPIRAPAADEDLRQLEDGIERYRRGGIDAEAFKRVRVRLGVYSLRGEGERYTLRIKVPLGLLSPDQMETAAQVCAAFGDLRPLHLTTRQGIEITGVPLEHLVPALRRLGQAGLTTRGAGGNVVRNVTACPLSGIAADEAFDVTPYALQVSRHFLRHPDFQDLPRKVKIAFEGCPEDHVLATVNDIGVFAARGREGDAGERGFRILVGGGLGASPASGRLLEPLTPEALLAPTCEAVLRVFHRLGERHNRARARLKFLVRDLGLEAFRREVRTERERVARDPARPAPDADEGGETTGGDADGPAADDAPTRAASGAGLRGGLVFPQRQAGFAAFRVPVPCGDLSVGSALELAALAHRFCRGRLRLTPGQDILLRWVPEECVDDVKTRVRSLFRIQAVDVTCCTGSATCISAITNAKALGAVLRTMLADDGPEANAGTVPPGVRISGCPHGCGHHGVADIGLSGTARWIGGRMAPHYRIFAGGAVGNEEMRFGLGVGEVPARRVPEAVRRLAACYRAFRWPGESWASFVERLGNATLGLFLSDLAAAPAAGAPADLYRDWGSDADFHVEARQGECAV